MGACFGKNKDTDVVIPLSNLDEDAVDYKKVHSAVRWNRPIPEIKALMTNAAALNCVDSSNGNCPIHIASQNGHFDIVELLIKMKCKLDEVNCKGNTALHMALEYDYYAVARALIDAGADANLLNQSGSPANRGIEGGKSLAGCAFYSAKTVAEIKESFALLKENDNLGLDKAAYVALGMKHKKNFGAEWTPDLQQSFKEILGKIPSA